MSSKKDRPKYICSKHEVIHFGKCAFCLFEQHGIEHEIDADGTAHFPNAEAKSNAKALLEPLGLWGVFESGEIRERRHPQKHKRFSMYDKF